LNINLEKAPTIRPNAGSGNVKAYSVKPSELATVQIPSGLTYVFFYDSGTNPATLKYLYGPAEDGTFSTLSLQIVGAATITNSKPTALAATLNGDNV
jgi:hypothetical protein